MQSLGAEWIRVDIYWTTVQTSGPTTYNWTAYDQIVNLAAEYNIKVIGIVSYSASWARLPSCATNFQCRPADPAVYATYAGAVAGHFKGKLGAIEIWNEPNISNFWLPAPSASEYMAIAKPAAVEIRKNDPTLPIISAGLAPADSNGTNISQQDFLTSMYSLGAKSTFDIIGIHPYSYPAKPSEYFTWSGWSRMAETPVSMRSIMTANGDAAKPLWMTEIGAPTNGPGAVSTCTYRTLSSQQDHVDECLQAQIVKEALARAKTYPWAGPTILYSYQDLSTNPNDRENFFGILRSDGSKKPSYAEVLNAKPL
jgi:polysaccharide biosynthesis protein PslG